MPISRRDLIRAGASAAALLALPRPLRAHLSAPRGAASPIRNPRVRELANRALEAAAAAGADYADVRLTHGRTREFFAPRVDAIRDTEQMVVGVRALASGYWGFASSPVWTADEMTRLGREAVHQARTMALGRTRAVALAPVPAAAAGHWTMPVQIDPFEVSPLEIVDHLASLTSYAQHFPGISAPRNQAAFHVQEKAFASTDGSFCTQRLYRSEGIFSLRYVSARGAESDGGLDRLTPAGVGWELYEGQPLRDHIARLVAELEEEARLPWKPVDVGRFDTACDAMSVTSLLDGTLGRATELDRALGYEANAGGTSYLNEPLAMVGTFQAGAPAITVTGDRSAPGGAATVKWDDEGVAPDELALVKDGVLTDFQTTREGAEWLRPYYERRGGPVRSHGCAAAPSALEAPLTHTPNLALRPGAGSLDFDGLIREVGKGIAVRELGVDMDFQSATGLAMGRVYEVKGGKRVARLNGAGFLFRATELWKGLRALGGDGALRRYGYAASKGEPAQTTWHSVTAPPAAFEQLTLVDIMRKA